MGELRVLIADDHPLFLRGVRSLLDAHDGIAVVAEAAAGVEAITEARAKQPDVAVLDLHMPGVDGVEATRRIVATKRAFSSPLRVPAHGQRVDFDRNELLLIRGLVVRIAQASGLSAAATGNFSLAVHEVATNSVVRGSGLGSLWFWEEPDAVVVEVRDGGFIGDPLVGRRVPDLMQEDGRGVWIANQLCDLVQIRSSRAGTQVRVRMWTGWRRPADP